MSKAKPYRVDRTDMVALGLELEALPEWEGLRPRDRDLLIFKTLHRMQQNGDDPWSMVIGKKGERNAYD